MLDNPKILMLNCVGSYYYSIIDCLSSPDTDLLLHYLLNGRLVYQRIDSQKTIQPQVENPWNYQPVVILDSQNHHIKIKDDFFEFLKESFNIQTAIIEPDISDLINGLSFYTNTSKVYLICTIDEYYHSKSKYYNTLHNKHYLLIQSFNVMDSTVSVIDSEKKTPYITTLDDLMISIFQSSFKHKSLYLVDCQNYCNKLQFNIEFARSNILNNYSTAFIDGIISDLLSMRSSTSEEKMYKLKGYYFNIVSKILPYLGSVNFFLRKYDQPCNGMQNLIKKWSNLKTLILLKTNQHDTNIEPFILKMERIKNENELFYQRLRDGLF